MSDMNAQSYFRLENIFETLLDMFIFKMDEKNLNMLKKMIAAYQVLIMMPQQITLYQTFVIQEPMPDYNM